MNMKYNNPIRFIPATKAYIWGGTTLKEKWGKNADTETIAECWELSSFPGAESIDSKSGKKLSQIISDNPEYFGGKANESYFPILVKLIDAAGDLSIQVHPDDNYAKENENGSFGKTEMWYIADAKEDAAIYFGFSKDTSRKEVAESIKNNKITDLLTKVPVKKGDSFFVPAGTVHALLSGVTVVEIQQNSNITYRVYDYDRRDKDGNPRELHIEKALDVLNYKKSETTLSKDTDLTQKGVYKRLLADCEYFHTEEVKITNSDYNIYPKEGFVTFTVAEGEGHFETGETISKGSTWLIPIGLDIKITGNLTLVVTII